MRRSFLWIGAIALTALMLAAKISLAAQASPVASDEKATHEPVFRVASRLQPDVTSKTKIEIAELPGSSTKPMVDPVTPMVDPAIVRHPLDPAIELATARLDAIRRDVKDYQAIMVKRERIADQLKEPEFAKIKVRNRRQSEAGAVPFSIYMRFLKPKAVRGREVIYVEGRNNGKLIAHDNGMIKLSVPLDPTGWVAMQNSRYPIYDAGIENLVVKLIEKAERDKAAGLCEVEFNENAKINDRPCTKIKVIHAEQKAPYDFHVAEVFIDNELQVPVRYAAYTWPKVVGGEPALLEEYTYLNLELNPGFTDKDFETANPEYEF